MTFKDVAGIALAVLWGGALCGLGVQAISCWLGTFDKARDHPNKDGATLLGDSLGLGRLHRPRFRSHCQSPMSLTG
jgi:hypothetical protein